MLWGCDAQNSLVEHQDLQSYLFSLILASVNSVWCSALFPSLDMQKSLSPKNLSGLLYIENSRPNAFLKLQFLRQYWLGIINILDWHICYNLFFNLSSDFCLLLSRFKVQIYLTILFSYEYQIIAHWIIFCNMMTFLMFLIIINMNYTVWNTSYIVPQPFISSIYIYFYMRIYVIFVSDSS